MEPVFKMLDWQREDIIDTLTSLVQQHLPTVVLKAVLPPSIPLFMTRLPSSEEYFNKLTAHCLDNTVQFQDFSITNNELNCKFLFMTNSTVQDIQVFKFPEDPTSNQDLIVKHLQNLVFVYSIPQTNLSFHVTEPAAYTFRWNSSYEQFVGHKVFSYTEFLNSLPPSSSSPPSPQPGPSVTTSILEHVSDQFANLPPYSQEASDMSIFKSPRLNIHETPSIHSIRPKRPFTDGQSRLCALNIASMKASLEPLNMSLSSDYIYNMLQQDKKWTNKDLAKLIMAINGIIGLQGPSDKTAAKGDSVDQITNTDELSDGLEET